MTEITTLGAVWVVLILVCQHDQLWRQLAMWLRGLGAMARTSSRMPHEPVKLKDRGLRQWQKDAHMDVPLPGVVVDLLVNIHLLLWLCYYAGMWCLVLISLSFLDHD